MPYKEEHTADSDSIALALDIGGTWTRAAAVSRDGRILASAKARTISDVDHGTVIDTCVRIIRAVVDDAQPVRGLGVSATGPIDPSTGVLFTPPNTGPGLAGLRLAPLLAQALGIPVVADRDTNAAALAEQRYGAARGCADFVYVTVSTGVGGAVFTNGQLLRGADGVAGEIGHVVVRMGGELCGCGRRGCLEAVASGPALAAAAMEIADIDGDSPLSVLRRKLQPLPIEGRHVDEAAQAGDPDAIRILANASTAIASAAVDLVNVFNPCLLVLGGSVVRAHPDWIAEAGDSVAASALHPGNATARVVAAGLGDDGGLLGAALLVS